MKHLFIPFIALGILFAALTPVSAMPPECITDATITFQHYGDNQVDLLFEPYLSTDCITHGGAGLSPFQLGNPANPYELKAMIMTVYHHERIGQTDDWTVSTIFESTWSGSEINGQDFGDPYYSVGGGINITGNSLAATNCYVFTASVLVLEADEVYGGYRFSEYVSESECVPGPDTLQVLEPFRDRPGELIPVPDPTHGTLRPGNLKVQTPR